MVRVLLAREDVEAARVIADKPKAEPPAGRERPLVAPPRSAFQSLEAVAIVPRRFAV